MITRAHNLLKSKTTKVENENRQVEAVKGRVLGGKGIVV